MGASLGRTKKAQISLDFRGFWGKMKIGNRAVDTRVTFWFINTPFFGAIDLNYVRSIGNRQ